jgi:hypothetical protein
MKTVFPMQIRRGGLRRVVDALLPFALGSLAVSPAPLYLPTEEQNRGEGTHFYLHAYANTGNFDWYRGDQKLPSQNSVSRRPELDAAGGLLDTSTSRHGK